MPVCGIAFPGRVLRSLPTVPCGGGQPDSAKRNGSRQGGGKPPGVRVVGAADAPGRLPFNSIIVGFGIFFNPALGPGASIGLFA